MLTYALSDEAVGAIRFGLSPLTELGLSLRMIRNPARYPLQLGWLRRTETARAGLDHEVLDALIDDRGWTVDFVNPRPRSPLTRIDDELAALAAIDPTEFRRDLVAVHGHVPAVLDGPHEAAVARVVAALGEFWAAAFEPFWPRIRAVLEADIAYRARLVAKTGVAEMLGGLSPRVQYDHGELRIRLTDPTPRRREVGDEGLALIPTMFTANASAPVGDGPPLLLYPARGQGALWEAERPLNPGAAAGVLGETRAVLLRALGEPASSTELAVRFDVTTSAVNQHLRALRAAGLLTSSRYGRSILYLRSPLGTALLAADPTATTLA
ncbi:ArsR/SmtB family transcription factor [Agromyces seonyuensis]|uniref:Helix-turn-helix domain-containing protein n=1 Tax=Agromyces seonyuensis TaxID=2662446 RepID=A0A6I4NYP1_9MICO|nr:DUF5937 family protein [Agromyces seonyuensis]MWB99490.1 helix-turn-helix domain-containing protein [Agromyces seonyuensis]